MIETCASMHFQASIACFHSAFSHIIEMEWSTRDQVYTNMTSETCGDAGLRAGSRLSPSSFFARARKRERERVCVLVIYVGEWGAKCARVMAHLICDRVNFNENVNATSDRRAKYGHTHTRAQFNVLKVPYCWLLTRSVLCVWSVHVMMAFAKKK